MICWEKPRQKERWAKMTNSAFHGRSKSEKWNSSHRNLFSGEIYKLNEMHVLNTQMAHRNTQSVTMMEPSVTISGLIHSMRAIKQVGSVLPGSRLRKNHMCFSLERIEPHLECHFEPSSHQRWRFELVSLLPFVWTVLNGIHELLLAQETFSENLYSSVWWKGGILMRIMLGRIQTRYFRTSIFQPSDFAASSNLCSLLTRIEPTESLSSAMNDNNPIRMEETDQVGFHVSGWNDEKLVQIGLPVSNRPLGVYMMMVGGFRGYSLGNFNTPW